MTTLLITSALSLLFGAFVGVTAISVVRQRRDTEQQAVSMQAELNAAKALQDWRAAVTAEHAIVHTPRIYVLHDHAAIYSGEQCIARIYDDDPTYCEREARELCEKINSYA